MKKVLIYTFRTNPYLEKIQRKGFSVCVFGSLKKGLGQFKAMIRHESPDMVLGLAISPSVTRSEPLAVNAFGKKRIDLTGESLFELSLLRGFPVAHRPTTTFCNWVMYKASQFLHQHKIKSDHVFIHFQTEDLDTVLDSL